MDIISRSSWNLSFPGVKGQWNFTRKQSFLFPFQGCKIKYLWWLCPPSCHHFFEGVLFTMPKSQFQPVTGEFLRMWRRNSEIWNNQGCCCGTDQGHFQILPYPIRAHPREEKALLFCGNPPPQGLALKKAISDDLAPPNAPTTGGVGRRRRGRGRIQIQPKCYRWFLFSFYSSHWM